MGQKRKLNDMRTRFVSRLASRSSACALAITLALGSVGGVAAQSCGGFKVLAFSKTAGFRHGAQITAGLALLNRLGAANGFLVDATEDASKFTVGNLSQYAAVVFLNTTGDILNASQQTAFETFMRQGGGFVGIHSAADTEYAWPFYGTVMGAWFLNHPAVQTADLVLVDGNHPATAHLPARFPHNDEWYNYRTNPANDPTIRVLLNLDESTYQGGTMGANHPIAWSRDVVGVGRSFYTGLGHTVATYTAPFFEQHLLGGIRFVGQSTRNPTVTAVRAYGAPSGTPGLALTGTVNANSVSIDLSGAAPGGNGVLALSTCSGQTNVPPLTVLVDVTPTHLLGLAPIVFDGAGRLRLTIPKQFALTAATGTLLFLQGAWFGPSTGLSNGLEVTLTP